MTQFYPPFQKLLLLSLVFLCFACSKEEEKVAVLNASPATLYISNNDYESLMLIVTPNAEWYVSSKPEWLNISPSSGVGNGEVEELLVSLNESANTNNETEGLITISSKSAISSVSVEVFLDEDGLEDEEEESPYPRMGASSDSVLFDYFIDEQAFYLKNEGNVELNWNLEISDPYLQTATTSGTLARGDSAKIVLAVDRGLLPKTAIYLSEVAVTTDQEVSLDLPVRLNNYVEEKWIIEGAVVDAEYDKNKDVFVAVFNNPNLLKKLDPSTQMIETASLNLSANCVSVGLDGSYAVVGHNGFVSHVDLATMKVLNTFSIPTDVFDIISAPGGLVYVFAAGRDFVRSIDLSTGTITQSTSEINYTHKAKLHPSHQFVYGASMNTIPTDFYKFDVSTAAADYLYDSPYHGDYEFGNDIWISEDGSKLYGQTGNIFHASATKSEDMLYAGKLEGIGDVVTLDHIAGLNKIFTIRTKGYRFSNNPVPELKIYNGTYFNMEESLLLPFFMVPDGEGGGVLHEAYGAFGAVNSSGTKYHLISKRASDTTETEEQEEYAVISLDIQ